MRGLYGLQTPNANPIPLKGVKVEGDILGRGARVRVLQRFKNDEKKPVEAIYRFPLPEGAAICGFRVRTGKRTVEGRVEEHEKAFEIYDKALVKGFGAYLLDRERPNIFTLSVGNLKPRQEAVIEVEYVTLLDSTDGRVRFNLPTTVSPRYVPAHMTDVDGIPEGERIHPEYAPDVPYGLSLSLKVHAGDKIEAVESPSHTIRVEMGKRPLEISLSADSVKMDRDFVLEVTHNERTASRAYRYTRKGESFVQLDFQLDGDVSRAGGKKTEREKKEIIFVLDCSGSMGGDSIREAKKALEICLKALEPGTAFNVYRFGSDFETLFEKPTTYDKKSLKTALEYLKQTDADLGGTEILAPLQHIYGNKLLRGYGSREIILITDGQVANEDEVFRLVNTGRPTTRVFSIGIGAGPNHHLIKGLARSGWGVSEYIYPGERIEPKVMSIFSRVSGAVLSDPVISWGAGDSEQAPGEPVFFGGSPGTVLARLPGDTKMVKSLTLQARLAGQRRKWEFDIVDVESPDLPIPVLWARERISDLESSGGDGAGGGSRQVGRKAKMIKDTIISLSSKYGVLSSLTSYVAVEVRKEKDKARGEIVLRKVPVLVTMGWHGLGSVTRQDIAARLKIAGDLMRRIDYDTPSLLDSSMGTRYSLESAPSDVEMRQAMRRKLFPGRFRRKPQLSTTDILTAIFSLQDVDGSFVLTAQVAKMLGLKIGDIKSTARKIKVKTDVDALRLLSTALVLKVLAVHFPAEMAAYRGLITKSTRWLRDIVDAEGPKVGRKKLMDWVESFVAKHVRIETS